MKNKHGTVKIFSLSDCNAGGVGSIYAHEQTNALQFNYFGTITSTPNPKNEPLSKISKTLIKRYPPFSVSTKSENFHQPSTQTQFG